MILQAETDYKEQLAIYINNLPPEQRKIELMKFMNSEAKSYHKSGPHNSPAKPQQVSPFIDTNSNCYLHSIRFFH